MVLSANLIFFESEQCHGLQKGHIARAKLPCCRVATLDSILNLIFYPEFDFDFPSKLLLGPMIHSCTFSSKR